MGTFFEDDVCIHDYYPSDYVYGDNLYTPDEYMGEKWWYIDGAPGYMISDRGRVWSEKSRIFIKPKLMDNHGHMGVNLCINGERKYFYIHRLMAKAFIPNPDSYSIVRHLNDLPYDNELDNLAWGTQKDNWRDSVNNGSAHFVTEEEREIGSEKVRRPVRAVYIKTGKENLYKSQHEAAKELGLQQANVWKVLNGYRAHTEGWYFEYLD